MCACITPLLALLTFCCGSLQNEQDFAPSITVLPSAFCSLCFAPCHLIFPIKFLRVIQTSYCYRHSCSFPTEIYCFRMPQGYSLEGSKADRQHYSFALQHQLVAHLQAARLMWWRSPNSYMYVCILVVSMLLACGGVRWYLLRSGLLQHRLHFRNFRFVRP